MKHEHKYTHNEYLAIGMNATILWVWWIQTFLIIVFEITNNLCILFFFGKINVVNFWNGRSYTDILSSWHLKLNIRLLYILQLIFRKEPLVCILSRYASAKRSNQPYNVHWIKETRKNSKSFSNVDWFTPHLYQKSDKQPIKTHFRLHYVWTLTGFYHSTNEMINELNNNNNIQPFKLW